MIELGWCTGCGELLQVSQHLVQLIVYLLLLPLLPLLRLMMTKKLLQLRFWQQRKWQLLLLLLL